MESICLLALDVNRARLTESIPTLGVHSLHALAISLTQINGNSLLREEDFYTCILATDPRK